MKERAVSDEEKQFSGYEDSDADAQYLTQASAPPATPSQSDDQTVETCLEMALPGLESGVAPDTIINAMFANLPEHVKQMLRQRMAAWSIERDNRQHEMARQTREKTTRASGMSRAAFDLAAAAALISEATMERIKKIFMSQPNLAQSIMREGERLLNMGVAADTVRITEASLGRISAPAIGAPARDRDAGIQRQ